MSRKVITTEINNSNNLINRNKLITVDKQTNRHANEQVQTKKETKLRHSAQISSQFISYNYELE